MNHWYDNINEIRNPFRATLVRAYDAEIRQLPYPDEDKGSGLQFRWHYVDFAQVVKVYGSTREGEQRYSPAEVIDCVKMPIFGDPDPARICTSHIERQNLTVRMSMRRMTRLTNAFSKKWVNHKAAYALYFAHYNFCRVHSSLGVTPAMEAGITDSIWTLRDLLAV